MSDRVIFNLKRLWKIDGKTVNLYNEIKSGRKTSEWRDAKHFMLRRLLTNRLTKEGLEKVLEVRKTRLQDLTKLLKVHKVWFVVGYPEGTLPRLEADITALFYHPETSQLEIKFTNVREILT